MALLSLGRNVVLEEKITDVVATDVAEAAKAGVVVATKDAGQQAAQGGQEAMSAVDAAASAAGLEAATLARNTGESTADAANKKLGDARKGLADSLTPWIPGDFLVTYGTLLTAWDSLRGAFWMMVGLSVASAFAFVFLGAIAEAGWGTLAASSYAKLFWRALIGAAISVYASFALPNSGWYGFAWMRDNESSVVLTAGLGVALIVLFLKTLPRSLGGTR